MYNIRFTDSNTPVIVVDDSQINNSTSITLTGREKLQYGQDLQESILHILENFSCPEDSSNPGNPNKTIARAGLFDNLIEGQCWFNSSKGILNYWDGTSWVELGYQSDIAANWGVIFDGEQIPNPISELNGKIFDYSECVWIVSPFNFPDQIDYLICETDNNALVNMKYRLLGTDGIIGGYANYMIIGISGNQNVPQVSIALSVTPTPTPTSTIGSSSTPTPTPTRSPTPTISPSPTTTTSYQPTPTPTRTRTPAPTPTPTRTRTPAPTSSHTPVASVTPTPTPTQTPASTTYTCAPLCPQTDQNPGGCCVTLDSYLPNNMQAKDVRVGDMLSLANAETLEPTNGVVSYSEPNVQECVRFITKTGVSLRCSTSAPIPVQGSRFVDAPYLLGELVPVKNKGETYWDEVVDVENIGQQWVQNITVGDQCYWAGENDGQYILHHNAKCCYCNT